MPTLATDFPSPPIERETFAGGFAAGGAALLTFDELSAYDTGQGRGAERLFRCPFCGASERAFHVNAETGRFNCKRSSCAVKGILREFWKNAPQLSGRAKSQARLRKAFELDAPTIPEAVTNAPLDASNWRQVWENALALDAPESEAARDYLSGRGACLESAIRAGARFCLNWAPSPEGKIYRGGAAILFPLRDLAGELRAVNGRYLRADANPKARTGGTLGEGAFWAPPTDGFNWRECDALAIVEGPFDALALAACGAAALSLGGVNLPRWFGRAVAFKAVSIGADADAAGEAAAADWTRQISGFTARVSRLRAPDGCKDFGEALEICARESLANWLREFAPQLLPAPAPEIERFPFAPLEVMNAATARGVVVTSYGWPVCYWAGDYADELRAARERETKR